MIQHTVKRPRGRPKKPNNTKKQFTVLMEKSTLDKITAIANELGTTRTAVVKEALAVYADKTYTQLNLD